MQNKLWRNNRRNRWLFRGQENYEWFLTPTAFRRDLLQQFTGIKREPTDWCNQALLEYEALLGFVQNADEIGLPIPGHTDGKFSTSEGRAKYIEVCFDTIHITKEKTDQVVPWPPCEIIETLALARHHGVPARMIDFTYNSLVAAFFAAYKAFTENSQHKYLAVWGIDSQFIHHANRQIPKWSRKFTHVLSGKTVYSHSNELIKIVTPPKIGNEFLRAQQGVFLMPDFYFLEKVWKNPYQLLEPKGLDTAEISPSIEYLIETSGLMCKFDDKSKVGKNIMPPVILVTAPTVCCDETLKLLMLEHIDLQHLMPTYDNVVESINLTRKLYG
ncbi:FRG domain-containing protein [bacterium]|nr:MAG: FRG domain-containing protein [bacterium]